MPDTNPLKILFVVNPVSGSRKKWNWETGIRDYFKNIPHRFEIYSTTGKDDSESLKYWIETWKPDKVVSVGGDGTLRLVSEILLGKNIPLCIFPAGSFNGMARELRMPSDPETCWKILFNGIPKQVDVLRINGKNLCIHLSDIGLNAHLVKYFEENDMRGKLGYAKEVFRVLWKKRLMEVTIKKGDEVYRRQAFMVVLANASMYGTGARINPLGKLDDGFFEVILLRKLSVLELLKMLFLNRPFNPEKTEIVQAESLSIEVKKKAYFQIDGEYLGKIKNVDVRIEKQVLTLIIPARDG